MYVTRLTLFSCISVAMILLLPAANLLTRFQLDGVPRLPDEFRALWSLDDIEGLIALKLWTCCDISLTPERVVIGQSGYLFPGNHYSDGLDRGIGAYLTPPDIAEDWSAHVFRIHEWLAERGIPFLYAIAPNKNSVYTDMLPEDLTVNDRTDTDTFLATAQRLGIPVLDARPHLNRLRETHHAYMITDSHWTALGAATAYKAILAKLSENGASFTPVAFEAELKSQGPGDLTKIMRSRDFLAPDIDVDYDLVLPDTRTCSGKLPYMTIPTDPCTAEASTLPSAPPIDMFRTPGAPNPETALLLCDSFCASQMELYTKTFETVYHAHWDHIDEYNLFDQMELLQPDVVIFQLVERNIYEVTLRLE